MFFTTISPLADLKHAMGDEEYTKICDPSKKFAWNTWLEILNKIHFLFNFQRFKYTASTDEIQCLGAVLVWRWYCLSIHWGAAIS